MHRLFWSYEGEWWMSFRLSTFGYDWYVQSLGDGKTFLIYDGS